MDKLVNLIKERRNAGLTVERLADLLGVHPNTVRGWERGEYEPNGRNLIQLATLFGCAPDYLLGMDKEKVTKKENLQTLK